MSEETTETVEFTKKQIRFRENAQKRTNKALEAISNIGALAKMPSAEPVTEDVDKIVIALHDAIEKMSERLTGKEEQEEEFTL